MPKVSVIVTVYNVEPYIERCLHTLFGQTLDDLEYIFVDDCSTDHSCDIIGAILKQYPHRINQTKILRHEYNKGVAAARTTGILAASGEYIIHCDPDDYIEENMYELMYDAAANTKEDIVMCNYFYEHNGQTRVNSKPVYSVPEEYLRYWYAEGSDYSSLWDKLIRRSLFIRNGIMPYEGIDSGEDFGCMVRVFYYARSITNIPLALYHYCKRENSITMHVMNRTEFDNRLKLVREISSFFKNKGYDAFCNNMKFNTKLAGRHLYGNNEAEWFNIFPECHRHIMSYRDNSFKSRLLWWLALRNVATYKLLKKYIPALG